VTAANRRVGRTFVSGDYCCGCDDGGGAGGGGGGGGRR